MAADPQLPVHELARVFGAEAGDAISVNQLYEPVVSASLGIWRVRAGGQSAVLKLVGHSQGGSANWRSGVEPTHWYYWRREVLAYESGLLDSLPGGLRAPRCRDVAVRDDGTIALWLEDLGDATASSWGIDRYRAAARHLGETQGSYLVGVPLPDAEWLSRGWLATYLSQRDQDMPMLDDDAVWRDPRIADWFPDPPVSEAKDMRGDQTLFLDALGRLPRTLCHLDLHPANLFANGDERTVAIDWAFVGLGAIGEDVGNLVPDAVFDFHVPAGQIHDLYEALAAGYYEGLCDAGWQGSYSAVRLGMSATIAAKYAWILPAMLRCVAEDRERVNGRPIAETLRSWAPAIRFLFERADEARDLARALGSS